MVTKDSFDPASTSFATRLDQPPSPSPLKLAVPPQHSHTSTHAPSPHPFPSHHGFDAAGAGTGGGGGPGAFGVAAAAAETQGPTGIDASYAVVHAAHAAQAAGRGGGGGGPGDLESWAMHPHVLNSGLGPGQLAQQQQGCGSHAGQHHARGPHPHGSEHPGQGGGHGVINGGQGGGLKILPVTVPSSGGSCRERDREGGGCGSGSRPGSRGQGAQGCGPGGAAAAAEEEQQALRAWLSQLPGGESMAQGFLDIRSSLIAFAQLYQLHQRRVEQALLKQAQGGQVARVA